MKNIEFDIIENENDYIIYKINNSEDRSPDLNDIELKKEIIELIHQKNKFEYNNELLRKINENKFSDNDFKKMGKDKIQSLSLKSVRDNKKFEINAVELLYSLPLNAFTLINDEKENIYLAKINNIKNQILEDKSNNFNEYSLKHNMNNKRSILKSYDILLNDKYNVVLNQKTIERVKNFFQ